MKPEMILFKPTKQLATGSNRRHHDSLLARIDLIDDIDHRIDLHFNNESNIKNDASSSCVNTAGPLSERFNDTAFQLRQYLDEQDVNNTKPPVLQKVLPYISETMQSSMEDKSAICMENLMKMKEEYIFVFSGFNDRFVTSIEVFDVSRGIWRDFNFGQGPSSSISSRTKTQVVAIFEDSLAVIGGKDEYGVPTDEIVEFNVKMMKSIPTEWRMPRALSGFASCLLKSNLYLALSFDF